MEKNTFVGIKREESLKMSRSYCKCCWYSRLEQEEFESFPLSNSSGNYSISKAFENKEKS